MAESSLVCPFVHDHSIFDIITSVGDDCDNCVCSMRALIEIVIGLIVSSDKWSLGEEYTIDLVVHSEGMTVIWSRHRLLGHLALIHVSWRLVVVSEGDGRGDYRQHVQGVELLMGRVRTQVFFLDCD